MPAKFAGTNASRKYIFLPVRSRLLSGPPDAAAAATAADAVVSCASPVGGRFYAVHSVETPVNALRVRARVPDESGRFSFAAQTVHRQSHPLLGRVKTDGRIDNRRRNQTSPTCTGSRRTNYTRSHRTHVSIPLVSPTLSQFSISRSFDYFRTVINGCNMCVVRNDDDRVFAFFPFVALRTPLHSITVLDFKSRF